ncbi:unnamed protein product [Gemmata massiliana]|uniref:Uncharacterized protein n=1 Tax=Gemmata massiliana TaxID=1210884 RepID=A0A6P2CWW4_9BACT|nr:hypothetical protein [Gemmata massiliana]VTR93077.1 unnamed protein product [Gemmata massiliana]
MTPEPVRVTFRGRERLAYRSRYPNGGVAVCLRDAEHGAFAAWATLDTPHADLKSGQIVVNDFDRTEGMLEALVRAGVVEPTGESVRFFRQALPIVTLRVEVPEYESPGMSNGLHASPRKSFTLEPDSGIEL